MEVREQDDVDYPAELARGPNQRREEAEEYQNDDYQTRPAKGVRAQTGRRDSSEGDPGRQNENQSPQEPRSRRTRRDHTQGTPSVAPERRREHQMEETPEAQEGRRNGHRWESDQLEDEDWDLTYSENLGHDRIAPISPDFYDINLTANLMRWAFQAKRRMGHERLMELLSLYLRSGHYSRELKEMISYICNMVEEDGAGVGEPDPSQEWVNLIHQLHGILAGGVPIKHGPGLKFADGDRSDGAERTFDSGV